MYPSVAALEALTRMFALHLSRKGIFSPGPEREHSVYIKYRTLPLRAVLILILTAILAPTQFNSNPLFFGTIIVGFIFVALNIWWFRRRPHGDYNLGKKWHSIRKVLFQRLVVTDLKTWLENNPKVLEAHGRDSQTIFRPETNASREEHAGFEAVRDIVFNIISGYANAEASNTRDGKKTYWCRKALEDLDGVNLDLGLGINTSLVRQNARRRFPARD